MTIPCSDFEYRCCEKFEALGDNAIDARQHDEAISQYSAALSLTLTHQDLLSQDALHDANEA
jgi:hypothetical protein